MIRQQESFALPVQESLGKLEQLADGLMRDIHRLAWELHPAVLDDLGLEAALRRYTAEWSENNGVPVDFHSDGVEARRLSLQLETTLYRITQEALTNGMRERVTLAGGTLEIESTPGAGTTVFVRVPLKQEPAKSSKL